MLTYSAPSGVICAENIALLHLLHSVPDQPSRNEVGHQPHLRNKEYSLSFDQEKTLASTLAFLSNTKNDTNHIPALCVEEDPASGSLDVVLAVNKTKWEDGNEVLRDLRQRLEKIFFILSEVSGADSSRATEYDVFIAIVSICAHRILGRLRFLRTKWGALKQPLAVVLRDAVVALEQVPEPISRSLPVRLFNERARELIRLADSWDKHRKPEELSGLVEGIYHLKQVGDVKTLLDLIPNRAMDPSSRQNLVNIISKVSRYREAARFLYRTAKRIPLLRRIKVVLVDLPRESFDRVSSKQYAPQLASIVERISANSQRTDVGNLCRLLSTGSAQLNDQFATQTRKTLREAKIHAEIQLVYHYELQASKLPPRVVCSSKDACYLCNTFLKMHSKMHTPRHHGRLYPGWRLPQVPNLAHLDMRLNAVLERRIEHSLKLLRSTQTSTIYPDPNESTLLTLPPSTSTLRTSLPAQILTQHNVSAINVLHNTTPHPNTSPQDRDNPPSPSTSTRTIAPAPPPSHRIPTTTLVQGVPHVISPTCGPQRHTAGALEVYIEYPAATPHDARCDATDTMEWLCAPDSRATADRHASALVDVEAQTLQSSREMDCRDDVLLMARGVFVRIARRRGRGNKV
ncbi:hypothetical protein BDU57DRAFT_459713 [Ampelomyces quisqualis]|uniref:Uncharacterized protein n=1 Tax=Ampelomyces quisqualis TaxID=50730 RepID=A0A6A5QBD7_AMPQU|nr:hypothetical protein BDU57DRAFT_459713 [Ampelomyces quisqualis]